MRQTQCGLNRPTGQLEELPADVAVDLPQPRWRHYFARRHDVFPDLCWRLERIHQVERTLREHIRDLLRDHAAVLGARQVDLGERVIHVVIPVVSKDTVQAHGQARYARRRVCRARTLHRRAELDLCPLACCRVRIVRVQLAVGCVAAGI